MGTIRRASSGPRSGRATSGIGPAAVANRFGGGISPASIDVAYSRRR